MNLKEKVVLLTGARRIGQTVAEELAKKGASLAIAYRSSKEESEAMCAVCIQHGVKAFPVKADLTKQDEIERLVGSVVEEYGRIDILVHMAAPYPKTPWGTLTIEKWDEINAAIPRSAFWLGKKAADVMLQNQPDENNIRGKIIYFSDWSINVRPYKDFSIYNAAKGAVESLTRSFAVELAPSVTVNCIAPGPILAPVGLTEEENKEVMSKTPRKTWGGAMSIANGVDFLLKEDFVTGLILPIDGGRTID